MNDIIIAEKLKKNNIPFSDELPQRLSIYLRLLIEWNQKMDLTAVETEEEMLDRHFIDSLAVLRTNLTDGIHSMIDVGTGAGFPGLVLAMARPEWKVTLLDSQKKRLLFLQQVIAEANTENVSIIHARAEDGARKKELREQFDAACARAVAPLAVLSEYLLPYVKTGGKMLCWKGPGLTEEAEAGRRAAYLLGGKAGNPVTCEIYGRDWKHVILPVEKVRPTPGIYPRKAGQPKNKPLA